MFRGLFGVLPTEQIQAQFTGLSQKQTFLQALTFLDLCAKKGEILGQPFERNGDNRIIDFGSGWGRITQLLSLYFNPHRIFGCDVMDQALVEAQQNHVRGTFVKSEIWPPSRIADASVDYIFSYSVFSHLREDNALAWVREFHRILRPGAIAFLTTRPKEFFSDLENLHKQPEVPGFASGASRAFRNLEEAKREYELGHFCFDGLGGGAKGFPLFMERPLFPQSTSIKNMARYFFPLALRILTPKDF
jgi:SAM-dependent methyltransferase